MPTYTTPFGDGVSVLRVRDVHNQFGPRDDGGTAGVLKTSGLGEQLIINFNAELYNDGVDTLVAYTIPAGAVIKAVYVDVEVPFVVTGTTPTVLIGTNGSEVTNGFVATEAIMEASGSANLTATLVGTWGNEVPLAVDTVVGIALGGTTPAITDVGKARFTIVYDRANLSL